ncbi:alcohol dehydrogenase catalytic domain-containing protein [Mesorhizobium sp. DCY119]|uniref:alcohol dehydrogenase catalytic domain-containing protein n=1 Tax=Mesorhizobium sp. DCY119 TaxID=2108445 RepID=UPI0018D4FA0D|nr:alcohol dehydrogenase catalytic domain-containing protein [Mesorhizobium sp. DCY119]
MTALDTLFDGAKTMRAIRITEDHAIDVIEARVPALNQGEILVRPRACGICGTDLHILRHGFPGTCYPVTPGHEFSGHVVAVGQGTKGVREGDFVAVDPNVVCGECRWCRVGRPNLCLHLSPIGVGRAGAAAEYVAVPAKNAFTVNEKIGAGVAALIEPLACAIHAVETAGRLRDRRVLVLGGGTMGMLIALASRKMGAGEITLADPVATKRAIATSIGIDKAVDPTALGDELFDVVFEAAGAVPALKQALTCVDKTGTLVQVGVHDVDVTVPINPFNVYEQEITIVGSNSLADKFAAAAELMPDLQKEAETLIGEPFNIWDFAAAVDSMADGRAIKTQLVFD